jgi:isoleucyl-tRNA synthetase
VWQSDDPAYPRTEVYGSIAELEEAFGVKVSDLHRPMIDELVRPNPDDPTGRSTMRRVPDVLDCWFESGAMPFAQQHYPFENKERFEQSFPGDFIVEYEAQTRGWFYTLMVLSTSLFDRAPFRNCVCHGVVLGDDNQKQSKRLKNYPDPVGVLSTHGADALRWFMMSSPLMKGGRPGHGQGRFRHRQDGAPDHTAAVERLFVLHLYANIDEVRGALRYDSDNLLDRYILAKTREGHPRAPEEPRCLRSPERLRIRLALHRLRSTTGTSVTGATASGPTRPMIPGTSRRRMTRSTRVSSSPCRALAPLVPLISERIYEGLTEGDEGAASVHLTDWPTRWRSRPRTCWSSGWISPAPYARPRSRFAKLASYASACRSPRLTVAHPDSALLESLSDLIAGEVNVKSVVLTQDISAFGTREIKVDASLGKVYGAKMKDVFTAQRSGNWTMREDGSVEIAGIVLKKGQYEMRLRTAEGIAAESFDAWRGVVALDTRVTDELMAEGWARDVVRLVQNARKQSRFDLTDRIRIAVQAHGPLHSALQAHREYIQRETLAVRMDFDAELPKDGDGVFGDMLDGEKLSLAISRVTAG